MPANTSVLIADDDKNICELLRLYLEKEGYRVSCVYDGVSALQNVLKVDYSIVILDIMMPEMDGIEVLKEIRKIKNIPVIMLTAKGETIDKILGLEFGADDYVVKPFEAKELIARIKAILRRVGYGESNEKTVSFDKISIDMSTYELKLNNEAIDIPPKELELLYYLSSHPNKVFTRDQLLNEVWGYNCYVDSRTVDVHVKRLREKINGISDSWQLKTVWSVGYKFEVKQ